MARDQQENVMKPLFPFPSIINANTREGSTGFSDRTVIVSFCGCSVTVVADNAILGTNDGVIDCVGDDEASVEGVFPPTLRRGRDFSNQSCSTPELNLRELLLILDSWYSIFLKDELETASEYVCTILSIPLSQELIYLTYLTWPPVNAC